MESQKVIKKFPRTNAWQQYYSTIMGNFEIECICFSSLETTFYSIVIQYSLQQIWSVCHKVVPLDGLAQLYRIWYRKQHLYCLNHWLQVRQIHIFKSWTLNWRYKIESKLCFVEFIGEVSWLGAITCLGATIGAMSFCIFVAHVGPKRSVLFLTVPYICVWLLIYFGNTIAYILCARFFVGFAGGGTDILILFISEVANDAYVF